jgi:hypothetical protein
MKRNILLLFLPLLMLACKTLFPEPLTRAEPVVAPATQALETPMPRPTTSNAKATVPAPAKAGFSLVRLHPKDGNLPGLLATEAQKAAALGQIPVVEFDATWCPPCKAIDVSLKEKNELMLAAFEGTYIIRLDVDEWGWDQAKYGFSFEGIPAYFKLDARGKPNGEVIGGDAWGDNIPENMAPPLDEFFHRK